MVKKSWIDFLQPGNDSLDCFVRQMEQIFKLEYSLTREPLRATTVQKGIYHRKKIEDRRFCHRKKINDKRYYRKKIEDKKIL